MTITPNLNVFSSFHGCLVRLETTWSANGSLSTPWSSGEIGGMTYGSLKY